MKSRLQLFIVLTLFVVAGIDAQARKNQFEVTVVTPGERVPWQATELLLEFSEELKGEDLANYIVLKDAEGPLTGSYDVEMYPGDNSGKTVWIQFLEGFSLNEASQYYVDVKKGLEYLRKETKNGEKRYRSLKKDLNFYFITTAAGPLGEPQLSSENSERTKIVVISDVHIGGPRATRDGYNWFGDNKTEFIAFLDKILASESVKELVVAGDLFDEWIMPVDVAPFVGDVKNSDDFFKAIAADETMKTVIDKMNEVANAEGISFVYVPGNHDMLMNETVFKAIFPNGMWKGTSHSDGGDTGTGVYWPATGVVIEHGHIYDFFNAPDGYSQTGSLLPPGYFVSRMYGTTLVSGKSWPRQQYKGFFGNLFFYGAWELVLWKLYGTIHPNIPSIITGIDGYTDDYTYASIRDHYYNADIAGHWKDRQKSNGVYDPESQISATLVGSGVWAWGKLSVAAMRQYLKPGRAKVVVFGHTHMAMLKGYTISPGEVSTDSDGFLKGDDQRKATAIYANSGTWIDEKYAESGYPTRTYVVVTPASRSSGVTTVSLYQYNPDGDGETDGVAVLLDEMNVNEISDESIVNLVD